MGRRDIRRRNYPGPPARPKSSGECWFTRCGRGRRAGRPWETPARWASVKLHRSSSSYGLPVEAGIEQPELHIHPAVQVGLGDLFIKGAKEHGINFLVETHSEHLILRLLRRIRETTENEVPPGAIGIEPADVAVIYVQSTESGVELVPLPIDATGEFTTRWPKGFFDERAEELF